MFTEGVLLLERVAKEGDLDRGQKAIVKDAIKAAQGHRPARSEHASPRPSPTR